MSDDRRKITLPRRLLEGLYFSSGVLAALFLALLAISIIAQIIGRLAGVAVDATEFSGFCMAASSFLGLGYTLRLGGHVRVGMLVETLSEPYRTRLEALVCAFSALLVGWLAWCALKLVLESWVFGDLSPGLLAMPFWIPQSAMALGLGILAVALCDELVSLLRGRSARYIDRGDGAL